MGDHLQASRLGACHPLPGVARSVDNVVLASVKFAPAAAASGYAQANEFIGSSTFHGAGYALRPALRGARPPGLALVREPDELGVERAYPQLAFGVRLVELAEPNRHVAADDDRTPARLDEDALVPVRVPGRWQQADSR